MNEIIYGIHAIQAMLESTPERFQNVFILKERRDKRLLSLFYKIKAQGIEVWPTNKKFLDKKSKDAIHQGIVAYIRSEFRHQEKNLQYLIEQFRNPFFLILDGITDIRNFGACLRSAEAAGVQLVIVPKEHSAPLNEVARKVACGAAESIQIIRVPNLARTMRMLKEKDIWIVGTTRKTNNLLYQIRMTNRIALVMGSENKGMRRLTRMHCNELIKIPTIGNTSSLNISVATGICLFEVVRQRI